MTELLIKGLLKSSLLVMTSVSIFCRLMISLIRISILSKIVLLVPEGPPAPPIKALEGSIIELTIGGR